MVLQKMRIPRKGGQSGKYVTPVASAGSNVTSNVTSTPALWLIAAVQVIVRNILIVVSVAGPWQAMAI